MRHVLAIALGFVLLAVGAADSASAAGFRWSAPIKIDNGGDPNLGISCPSKGLCVAGSAGGLFVSTNPAGRASAWDLAVGGHEVYQGSCPSVSFCAFPSFRGVILTSNDPSGGASAWRRTTGVLPLKSGFPSLSCASRSLCVEVLAGQRKIAASTHPSGGKRPGGFSALANPPIPSRVPRRTSA